jgi:hypothetical protein
VVAGPPGLVLHPINLRIPLDLDIAARVRRSNAGAYEAASLIKRKDWPVELVGRSKRGPVLQYAAGLFAFVVAIEVEPLRALVPNSNGGRP